MGVPYARGLHGRPRPPASPLLSSFLFFSYRAHPPPWQATEGHDDVVEFSGLEIPDVADGIKGEDWVTIPPPLSWFTDKE